MSFTTDHDIADLVDVARGSDNVAVTAGGSGDNALVTGQSFDRFAIALPLTAMLGVSYKATLAATATLSLSSTIEHSDDNATFFTYQTNANAIVATGPAGGGTVRGIAQVGIDLAGAKQYVRAKFTPDLSSGSVDTAELSSFFVLGGQRVLPV